MVSVVGGPSGRKVIHGLGIDHRFAKLSLVQVTDLMWKMPWGEVYQGQGPQGLRLLVCMLSHDAPDDLRARFAHEDRLLAAVEHANVVRTYFIGELEGRLYRAMEFVEGQDVEHLIRAEGPLRPGDAAEIVRQAAMGLLAAQRVGLLHNDLRPSSLFIINSGKIKVSNFWPPALWDGSSTFSGLFEGDPHYLAPEQAMGEEIDSSASVYSLGCILYRMCTGNPPFQGVHYTAVVHRHLNAERPVLTAQIPGFDQSLSDLCHRMMSRRSDVRPTLEELISDLSAIIHRLGGQIPPRSDRVEFENDGTALSGICVSGGQVGETEHTLLNRSHRIRLTADDQSSKELTLELLEALGNIYAAQTGAERPVFFAEEEDDL